MSNIINPTQSQQVVHTVGHTVQHQIVQPQSQVQQALVTTVPMLVPTVPVNVLQRVARVRFIHNMTNGPLVNIYIDGALALKNVPYPTTTDYLPVSPDSNNIQITDTDNKSVLLNTNITFKADDYTIIIHGTTLKCGTPVRLLVLKDDHYCPGNGNAKVRFVHASADAPSVNVYLNKQLAFKDVSYGNLGKPNYIEVNPGVSTLDVTPANSNTVVIGPISVQFQSNKVYTIVASGAAGNAKAPLGVLIELDNRGVCYYK